MKISRAVCLRMTEFFANFAPSIHSIFLFMLTTLIVAVFVMGYLCITLEDVLKVNKAAVALLMCVVCWVLYTMGAAQYVNIFHLEAFQEVGGSIEHFVTSHILREHMGEVAETLFFLIGAMTVVEIIDTHGGFNFVREALKSKSKRSLLWKIAFMTFFLSAVLDNLTTTIVMIMVLRKVVSDHNDRIIYASLVVLAANSGGAFSPIGDVTTIMLWIKGALTTAGVVKELFLPSLVAMIVPAFILQYSLKGNLCESSECAEVQEDDSCRFCRWERNSIFAMGVGGLLFVPVFHGFTHLPPFMGILLVLGGLWTMTELFYRRNKYKDSTMKQRVTKILRKIDMTTILFFLGILLAVATLKETGVLPAFGVWLNEVSGGDHFLVTGVIGVASAIVDNVPLVAGCMSMYTIEAAGAYGVDGVFWQLLAYCAGVGGSMLIIGSAAGVVAMGLEKIPFGWYMKKITWVAAAGYFAGMAVYYVERVLFHL